MCRIAANVIWLRFFAGAPAVTLPDDDDDDDEDDQAEADADDEEEADEDAC